MSFKIKIIFCFLSVFSQLAVSQVEINNNLIFLNPVDTANQFYNVHVATDSSEALTNKQLYDNELFLQSSCNNDVINLTTDIPFNVYEDGMSFEFVFPNCINEFPVIYLNVNNIGNIEFNLINQQDSVKYLKEKFIKVIIYNNKAFSIPSHKNNKCPNGFVKINQNYCIQYNRNAKATFWNANKNCSDTDTYLCSPEEWISACLNHNTLLSNMPLNWEWLNSGSNHNLHAPIIGNSANCNNVYTETTAPTGLTHFYRCCYKLR